MSSEHPIIFSGESVRKILRGDKTQTRRIIKPQFGKTWGQGERFKGNCYSVQVDIQLPNREWKWIEFPFGKVGDRLWVRETWADEMDATGCPDDAGNTLYRATDPGWDDADSGLKWKSPIYMPRVRSRLALEITGVRAERLQEISDGDIEEEGVRDLSGFQEAWDKLNKTYPWSSNPFVWVIEFSRV